MATITETGTIDLAAQKEAHDEAINAAASDATSKANAAAKTATNYITADSTGITVRMSQNVTTYQRLTASESTWYVSGKKRSSVDGNGLKVYVGNAGSEVEVATFGSTVRLGKASEGHLEISQHDMAVYSDSSTKVMTAKSLNTSSSGYALIEEYARIRKDSTVSPPSCYIYVNHKIEDINCVINFDTSTTVPFTKYNDFTLKYSGDLNANNIYNVIYYTSESVSAMELGAFAMAVGANSLAVGESMAGGSNSIAYGDNCEALGYSSISGGNNSKAFGRSSVAIGEEAIARFNGAVAFGNGTYANAHNQFVIGENNIIDNPNNFDGNTGNMYAFIIGNGDSSTRSNAFAVDWSGNVYPTKKTVLKSLVNRDNPSSTAISDNDHSVYITDADGERVGTVRVEQSTGGAISLSLMSIGEKTDGTEVINQISLNSLRDGSRTYYVADPAAFRSAISATGAVAATSNTIPNLLTELRYTIGGRIGSVSIGTAYTNGATIPTGWYNYMWIPHRNGGSSGDNGNFGALILCGMTVDAGPFWVRYDNGSIGYVRDISLGSTGKVLPRGNGGTGMSARTTGTVTRSGLGTDGTINVYSNGVTCTLAAGNVKLNAALANSSTVQIATLPTGYRPPMNVFTNISSPAQSPNGGAWVRVDSAGVVTLGNYSGAQFTTSTQLYFTITWAL